jgi:hypothetical protein
MNPRPFLLLPPLAPSPPPPSPSCAAAATAARAALLSGLRDSSGSPSSPSPSSSSSKASIPRLPPPPSVGAELAWRSFPCSCCPRRRRLLPSARRVRAESSLPQAAASRMSTFSSMVTVKAPAHGGGGGGRKADEQCRCQVGLQQRRFQVVRAGEPHLAAALHASHGSLQQAADCSRQASLNPPTHPPCPPPNPPWYRMSNKSCGQMAAPGCGSARRLRSVGATPPQSTPTTSRLWM